MPLDPLRPAIDRRSFLMSAASLACASLVLRDARAGVPAAKEVNLVAAPARLPIVGAPYPETDVWCYSGQSPGPEIRVRQGDHVRIVVDNRLSEDTTVHWHGLRVPNAMDGAPDVTQPSIQPGESFSYEFAVRDAGTYWYHPSTAPSRWDGALPALSSSKSKIRCRSTGTWSGCWAIGDCDATRRLPRISTIQWK